MAALTQAWAVVDGPCGKVLQPALAPTLENLVTHGHLQLDQDEVQVLSLISPATIDRRLATARTQLQVPGKGRSMTKPGSMLKSQIPMKTWAQWDDTTAGFVEIDLVAHEGGDNNGSFAYTLSLTDVATGWVQAATIPNTGEKAASAALGTAPPGPSLPPGRDPFGQRLGGRIQPVVATVCCGAGRSCSSKASAGVCWDNAAAESFFATLKNEMYHRYRFVSRARARFAVAEYIEVFYNRQRLHSSLGYKTPAAALTEHHDQAVDALIPEAA